MSSVYSHTINTQRSQSSMLTSSSGTGGIEAESHENTHPTQQLMPSPTHHSATTTSPNAVIQVITTNPNLLHSNPPPVMSTSNPQQLSPSSTHSNNIHNQQSTNKKTEKQQPSTKQQQHLNEPPRSQSMFAQQLEQPAGYDCSTFGLGLVRRQTKTKSQNLAQLPKQQQQSTYIPPTLYSSARNNQNKSQDPPDENEEYYGLSNHSQHQRDRSKNKNKKNSHSGSLCSTHSHKDHMRREQQNNNYSDDNYNYDDYENDGNLEDDDDDDFNSTHHKSSSTLSGHSEYFKQDSKDYDAIYENINQLGGDGDTKGEGGGLLNSNQNTASSRSYAEWSWSQFLEFFFYHLLYYIFGPLCVIFFYPARRMTLYKNLGFQPMGDYSLTQFTFWALNLIVTTTYFVYPKFNEDEQFFEIYNMWIMLVFRMFSIACKYAMFHPFTIHLYKHSTIAKQDKAKDFYLGNWFDQTDSMKLLELHGATKRNEIELALFNMHFFWEVNEETRDQLNIIIQKQASYNLKPRQSVQQHQQQVALSDQINHEENQQHINSKINKIIAEDLSNQNTDGNDDNNNAQNRKSSSPCDARLFFNGTVILQHLIETFNAKYTIYKNFTLVFFVAFFRSQICLVFRIIKYSNELSDYTPTQWLMVALSIIYNTLTYYIIGLFMIALLADLHRIYYLMIQMLFLIKPKKDDHFLDYKKVFPTLNLVCSNNFKNWILLRKLAIDYGKRFWMRGQTNLSFMVLYSLYPIVCMLLHLLDIFHFCVLEIYFLLYDFIIVSFSVAICLYLSASINYSYVYHVQILEEIRILFRNLLRDDLLQVRHEMSNYLYRIIVKRLREHVKNDISCFKNAIHKIIDAIDDSKSELVLLQSSQPFECFGMSVTFAKLKSLLLFLFSITTFSINFYFKTKSSSTHND